MRYVCSVFVAMCTSAAPAAADFVVSADPTQNVNCSGTTCVATARTAILNVQDLENRLASSSVKLASGGGAQDIVFAASISWTSGSGLKVDAKRSIRIRRAISVAGDNATVTLQTNDGGSGGDLLVERHGKISFFSAANSLTINGKQYVLVNSLPTLASAATADPAGHFALANGYDASADGTYAAPPVAKFRGTFEGLGHAISGLTINDPKPHAGVGLFGVTGAATIRDLTLRNVKVSSSGLGSFVGGLAGLTDGGLILNVDVSGVISGAQSTFVGGLTGFNRRGSVHNRFVYATIARSHSFGQVTGGHGSLVGGLAGASTGVLLLSSSGASVTGGNRSFAGGLAGYAVGYVENSYATGPVAGGDHAKVGGITGLNAAAITESYALGSVTAGQDGKAGGLVGAQAGYPGLAWIIESYSAGHVSGGSGTSVGGMIGVDNSTGQNGTSYWDIDTSGQSEAAGNIQNDPGIAGLTDAQLRSGLPPDFDPKDWAHDPSLNNGLPYLKTNRP